jgi:hypothetical protein
MAMLVAVGTFLLGAAAYVFTAAIIIPIADCLTVLATSGPADLHFLVHGLTAVYMIITSCLLFKNSSQIQP